jgi:AcrR family transcriptional regulator
MSCGERPVTKLLTDLRKSPRQKRATATFEAIVEAAAHILRTEGAAALTTNAIAARAGVSIGSLYQYFPNKQAIVRALIEREFKYAEAIRPALIDGNGPKSEIVRAIVDWHFELRAHDPQLALRLRALAAESLPEQGQLKITTLRRERVGRTIAKLVGPGREGERTHAAFIVDTCINAIADATMKRDPERLKSEGLRAEVTALLIGYLRPD